MYSGLNVHVENAASRGIFFIGLIIFMLCVPLNPVWAHGGSHGDVVGGVPTIEGNDKLPEGISVSALKTNAWQFALAAKPGQNVEILDDNLKPFIRIQEGKVQANTRAAAWHRAQLPGGGRVPDILKNEDLPDKWLDIAEQTGYGWYDKRLLDEDNTHFTLPIRVDGTVYKLDVVRREADKPEGFWKARVTAEPSWTWLSTISSGSSGQALMLSLLGPDAQPVEIMDANDQAFIRLQKDGVWVDASHEWADQLALNIDQAPGQEQWVQVANSPRFLYTDPRLALPEKTSHEPLMRSIPIQSVTSKKRERLEITLTYSRFD
ncbi:MAG: hypothetical protein R3194_00770 [Limnobacter sp.]|nr:hypothetical protein [Limnobacter sp.]